jgi:hypothetical protein
MLHRSEDDDVQDPFSGRRQTLTEKQLESGAAYRKIFDFQAIPIWELCL